MYMKVTYYLVPCDIDGLYGWVATEDPKIISKAMDKVEKEVSKVLLSNLK